MRLQTLIIGTLGLCYGAYASPSPVSLTPDATGKQTARPTCILRSRGDELWDDGRDILTSTYNCHDGGVVVIPAGSTIMVRSALNLGWCRGCEIQIEGTLKTSNNYEYWNGRAEMIDLSGLNNVTIRSVTGQGLIDGNMAGMYLRDRWPDRFSELPSLLHIRESSNISISNLKMKNAGRAFITVDGLSSNITLSSLNLTVEGQYQDLTYTQGDSTGLFIQNSTRVYATGLNVFFSSNKPEAKVGTCVAIAEATDTIEVSNITCFTGHGVMVKSRFFRSYSKTAKNVYVSDLIANTSIATGFQLSTTDLEELSNITWDRVTVLDGQAAVAYFCWEDIPLWTARCAYAATTTRANLSGIHWKNFKGRIGPDLPDVRCPNEKSSCDFHFEQWMGTNATRLQRILK